MGVCNCNDLIAQSFSQRPALCVDLRSTAGPQDSQAFVSTSVCLGPQFIYDAYWYFSDLSFTVDLKRSKEKARLCLNCVNEEIQEGIIYSTKIKQLRFLE